MKCPNCGAEMPVGSLYCEQCGEDIHIVPDFEPEVEFNMEQTIHGIAEKIREEQEDAAGVRMDEESGGEDAANRVADVRKKRSTVWILSGILFLCLVIGGILWHQYNSLSVQLKKAARCVDEEEYDKAIKYYTRALDLDDGSNEIRIKFDLAEVYFLKNNKIEYEYLLRKIAGDERASKEQVESAYGKLIAIYRAREDFKSINDLLLASGNEEVMRTYLDYVAMPPEFSVAEGYYTELQPLKLSAYGTGQIYYTLDGTVPDENSAQYTAPIILDDGDYTVSAYFVNQYGSKSEVVTKSYHVEIDALPIPEVSAVSGDYKFPIDIEILGETKNVYYTTDGSAPSIASNPYTGPIPMPLGKTNFKFVRMEGARSSEVVERTYSLVMNTEYTPEEAVADVVAYSLQSGKIYDEAGHFDDSGAVYQYEYRYVTNIGKIDDFYVVSEVLRDAEGNAARTGSHFAVNAYHGELYRLEIDDKNNYTIVAIEGQPEEEG